MTKCSGPCYGVNNYQWSLNSLNMKKIVDVFKRKDRSLVWTYVISLDRARLTSGIVEFEHEALRLSALEERGGSETLTARVRPA